MGALPPWGMRRVRAMRALRRVLAQHQAHICALCGCAMLSHERSADHVIARSRGGFDGLGNIVACHIRCNVQKNDRPPTGCEVLWLSAVNLRMGIAT